MDPNLTIGSLFRRQVSVLAGESIDGFLPNEYDISSIILFGVENTIVFLIDNELKSWTIPQGIKSEDYLNENRLREETFPPARFDFSPFGGLHRPVKIITYPTNYISDIKVDSKILPEGKGSLSVKISTENARGLLVRTTIKNGKTLFSTEQFMKNGICNTQFEINDCHYWSPKNPYLYTLIVNLGDGEKIVDSYELKVGIREVKIKDNQLFINNEKIYLTGFGKHEDFSVLGKGLSLPVVIKDYQMLKWINANSFRTSHYPYAEETMQLADKLGFLIIDEVPANSLDFRKISEQTLANHKKALTDLINRDYNHPSVIMWSLGNEPNLVGEESYYDGRGKKYWKEIFDLARSIDSLRPMTVPNCLRAGINDPVLELSDVVCINRYYGWYEYPGRIEDGMKAFEKELEEIFKRYGKPVLMSEFGADTIPGLHSTSDQIFTEEYQSKLLEAYIKVLRSKEYTIGEHVWNFADFRTPQHHRRVMYNMKGVFTRDRLPKAAAFRLKEIWNEKNIKE